MNYWMDGLMAETRTDGVGDRMIHFNEETRRKRRERSAAKPQPKTKEGKPRNTQNTRKTGFHSHREPFKDSGSPSGAAQDIYQAMQAAEVAKGAAAIDRTHLITKLFPH